MIYLLLEHQSIPDRLMGFRVLNYMMQVWDMQRRGWVAAGTPASECWLLPVLPLVLYTGKRRWRALPTLETIMRVPEALTPFIPRYDTLFLNLRATSPEQLHGSAVSCALQVLQVEDAPLAHLQPVLSAAVALLEEFHEDYQAEWRRVMHFLLALIRNRRENDEQDELTTILTEAVRPEHREEEAEMVMTGAEYLVRQGREEGLQIGLIELLLSMLEDKFGKLPMEVVTTVKALPLSRLKTLAHQILTAQHLSDLHMGVTNA